MDTLLNKIVERHFLYCNVNFFRKSFLCEVKNDSSSGRTLTHIFAFEERNTGGNSKAEQRLKENKIQQLFKNTPGDSAIDAKPISTRITQKKKRRVNR